MNERAQDALNACFDNICKNYDLPAGLHITDLMRSRERHDQFHVFIDVHTGSSIHFFEKEVWMNYYKEGVKSKKDYRKLRRLVRAKLVDSIRQLHDLAEDSLRNLGLRYELKNQCSRKTRRRVVQ